MSGEPLFDPLAVLFRPNAPPPEPMSLSETHIEVRIAPTVAHVRMTRMFTNASAELIEGVLTLPLAPDCRVMRLVVDIDGVSYRALPRSALAARQDHDRGVEDGRLAILCERVARDVLIVVIAGLKPGALVRVTLDLALRLMPAASAGFTLTLPMSVDPASINRKLDHADQLVVTARRHPAWLMIAGRGLSGASLAGHGALTIGGANAVPCNGSLVVRVVFGEGDPVEQLEWPTDVLDGETSLVFVGSAGEMPDLLPRLRKIALPAPPDFAVSSGGARQATEASARARSWLARCWRWWLHLLGRQ